MRRITITGAACALVGLLASPAYADCVQQIVQVKQMADASSDPAKREMAVQHLGMAQEKVADVQGSSMQGETMKGEMMSEDKGMAMQGEAMPEGQGEAMKDETMSEEHMATEGEMMSEDKGMAMQGEAMPEEHGMAMKDETMSGHQDMAMMEDECMAEVMKAQAALQ